MDLQVFENEEFGTIRTIEKDGKILFCGSDVAKALGYINTKSALARHCKEDGVAFHDITDKLGRIQRMKFINEGNLYRLITHSKLKSAEKFESWVFDEVLPTIRKHGAYMTQEKLREALLNPDMMIRLLMTLKEEQEKAKTLENEIVIKNQQIMEMKPKASYYDLILNCKDLIPITVIAKDYGWTAKDLNLYLSKAKIQFKQGGTWLLYQKYTRKGYTSTRIYNYKSKDGTEHMKVHTYWTQKGRLFIYHLLKNKGILPLIERGNRRTPKRFKKRVTN